MSGVHALVLAAGSGARFGGGKLMAPWGGGVLIDGALDAAFAAPVDGVTVVTGADPRVAVHAAARGAAVVDAHEYAQGLSASLKAGIAALPPGVQGVLVLLGDMPRVPRSVLAPLVGAIKAGALAAAPEFDARLGNPAALSSALFAKVAGLEGDRGARSLLEGLGPSLARIPSPDSGVLFDVDRLEDLAAGAL